MSQRFHIGTFVSLFFAVLAAPIPVSAQCPPQTSVADTVHNADGSLAEGRVVIAWPTFQAGSCQVIAGQISVTISAGVLNVPLYPNDAAMPAGTSYRATYYLKSARITTEYWVVPSSLTPVPLATVRSPSVPVPAVMVSEAQVTNLVADLMRKVELPAPCPAGKFLQASGSASPPQVNCVDGTGAPLASPSQSGTVKTDVTQSDPLVYTRASADALLAGKAAASHSHSAPDTTSGVFDPARIPSPSATTLGGVSSGTCSGADKMNGVSTAGAILCAADQTGSASQHQVNGANLAANDPINFQDTSTIALVNPSAGTVQATLKDSSVAAAKLAASGPTNAQLSGIDDDNIASAALSPNRIAGTAEVQSNKGAANGYAALNGSSQVAQNPASAQASPAASKIPLSDGAGKLDDGWLSANVSLLGSSISLTSEVAGTLPLSSGGTSQTAWTASRCVQVNSAGTALESAAGACGTSSGDSLTVATVSATDPDFVDTAAIDVTLDTGATPDTIQWDIKDDAVTDPKLRNSAALSVIGRAANSSGDPADIAAGSDGQVLRRSGTALGFGAVNLASSNAVTGALPEGNVDSAITRDSEWPAASATLTNKTLDVEGTGNSLTTVSKVWLEAAGCQNSTAALMWDTPISNPAVAACVTGTNTQKGVADFADSANLSMQRTLLLPADWTGNVDVLVKWLTSATTGSVVWQVATVCVADSETDDPSFNTASTVTDTAKGTANQTNDAAISSLTVTGCAAGELLHLKMFRDSAHASDSLAATARLVGIELTLRRAQ